jgi:hypothetical protein
VNGGDANVERGVNYVNGFIQIRQMQTSIRLSLVRELLCLRDHVLELSNQVVFTYNEFKRLIRPIRMLAHVDSVAHLYILIQI